MKQIPKSLRTWFTIHFIVDMIFAIPLIVAPFWVMSLLGLEGESMLAARLVGAALIGIGGASFLTKEKGLESYNSLLTLKILWSIAAQVAIILSIMEGSSQIVWILFATFFVFMWIWIYYKLSSV